MALDGIGGHARAVTTSALLLSPALAAEERGLRVTRLPRSTAILAPKGSRPGMVVTMEGAFNAAPSLPLPPRPWQYAVPRVMGASPP